MNFFVLNDQRDCFFSWSPSRLHLPRVVLHKIAHVSLICSFVRLSVRYGRGDTIKGLPILLLSLKNSIFVWKRACLRHSRGGATITYSALFRKRNLRVIIAASNISTRDKPFTWLIEAGISQAYGALLFFSEHLAASCILSGLQKPLFLLFNFI